MHTQHGTRRWILGALLVLMAASAALGTGHGASAADDDGPYPIKGYESLEDFKANCEAMGGTFSKDSQGETYYCDYPDDDSSTWCDANGGDCWRTPTRLQWPGVELTAAEPAPLYDSPPAADVRPRSGRGEFIETAPQDAGAVVATR